ncbi:MAG: hypothetical protein HC908_10100 [Calothrix sp. SM1_7_51]|nr:hypothetical protein [Calothrix sp. SM1_7_51]
MCSKINAVLENSELFGEEFVPNHEVLRELQQFMPRSRSVFEGDRGTLREHVFEPQF